MRQIWKDGNISRSIVQSDRNFSLFKIGIVDMSMKNIKSLFFKSLIYGFLKNKLTLTKFMGGKYFIKQKNSKRRKSKRRKSKRKKLKQRKSKTKKFKRNYY